MAQDNEQSKSSVWEEYLELAKSALSPEAIPYSPVDQQQLANSISAWLRPGYEQAIADRREETKSDRAAVDVDAASRGMGSSSFVSDMKNRAERDESRDVGVLENDYSAALGKLLMEALENDSDRGVSIQIANQKTQQDANEKAYDAAMRLYEQYLSQLEGGASGGGGGGSRQSGDNGVYEDGTPVLVTSAENCIRFLSGLSRAERAEIYNGTSEQGRRYQSELIASLGYAHYAQLQEKYPGT